MEYNLCQMGRAQNSFSCLGLVPAQLWASRPQLPVYEAKAVVGKKMISPVTVAGVWALKLSPHGSSISITGKRWGSIGSILSGTSWDS